MNFKHLNGEGTATCSLAVSHLWADVYGIDQRGSGTCSADDWSKLINQATHAAFEKGAKSVNFRVIEKPEADELLGRLPNLGFAFKEGRVEYRAFLSDLPDDHGSPLIWKTAMHLGWTDEQIGDYLREIAKGAPDFEPGEDPHTYIQDWLKDPVLISGPECISIGFIDGRPTALVVAQVNSRTLWSRISYMGLIPEARGQGFGKWIHRRGFTMLKEQGGDLYHGGTNSQNEAMIRLFENHGCRPYHRMQEWIWKPQTGDLR